MAVLADLADVINDLAHESVFHRLLGAHPIISLGIFAHTFDALPCAFSDNAVDTLTCFKYFSRMNLNVCCIAAKSTAGLVDQKSSIWQRKPVVLVCRQIDVCSDAAYPTGADDTDLGLNVAD